MMDFTTALPFSAVTLDYNCLDRPGMGEAGAYLTLLGTSAEDGDSGEVGRGNSVRGVIAVNRHATAEAAAGKNPVSHVGKIYSILAQIMADEIFNAKLAVKEARVWLLSSIGSPVEDPASIYVEVIPEGSGFHKEEASHRIKGIVEARLTAIDALREGLIRGDYPMC
ncbi:MAG: methionine adenosyltransferase, partial [Thermodesulfobacteriota bacterium]